MSTPPTRTTDVEPIDRESDGGGAVFSYTPSSRPSIAVVTAVSAAEDVDPTALEPLHDAVDTDALDRLADHCQDRDRGSGDARVTFSYAGYEVELDYAGRIRLVPLEQSE